MSFLLLWSVLIVCVLGTHDSSGLDGDMRWDRLLTWDLNAAGECGETRVETDFKMAATVRKTSVTTVVSDARELCEHYHSDVYSMMVDDQVRTESYRSAIEATVVDKRVLDLGTGASALLALIASHAGAKSVIGVEANKESAKYARELTEGTNIQIIEGYSTEMENHAFDVVVHEIFGEIASIEGVVYSLADVFRRQENIARGKELKSIPFRARTLVAPIRVPDLEYWSSRPPTILDPGVRFLKLKPFPSEYLMTKEWGVMEDIIFEPRMYEKYSASSEIVTRTSFHIDACGMFWGLISRLQIYMTEEEVVSIDSWQQNTHWEHGIVLGEPQYLHVGDVVEVVITSNLWTTKPTYTFHFTYIQEEEGTMKSCCETVSSTS